jgi:hypothetical protein
MKVNVSVSGPLFQHGGAPVRNAIDEAIKDLMAEGEERVKDQLYKGHGLLTGHYRRSVHGELVKSLHGVVNDSNVVYGPWLEGVGSRNQTTRFKGYAMFRNATQHLQRIAHDILRRRIGDVTRRLN